MRKTATFFLTACILLPATASSQCGTTLECSQKAVEAAQAAQSALQQMIPSGAVIAFDLEACPAGWSEYEAAFGRFIRGIDRGEVKIDPDGERLRGHLQDDEFKNHNHNNDGWNKLSAYDGSDTVHSPTDRSGGELNIRRGGTIVPKGGPETRPKNVALLFCRRD